MFSQGCRRALVHDSSMELRGEIIISNALRIEGALRGNTLTVNAIIVRDVIRRVHLSSSRCSVDGDGPSKYASWQGGELVGEDVMAAGSSSENARAVGAGLSKDGAHQCAWERALVPIRREGGRGRKVPRVRGESSGRSRCRMFQVGFGQGRPWELMLNLVW